MRAWSEYPRQQSNLEFPRTIEVGDCQYRLHISRSRPILHTASIGFGSEDELNVQTGSRCVGWGVQGIENEAVPDVGAARGFGVGAGYVREEVRPCFALSELRVSVITDDRGETILRLDLVGCAVVGCHDKKHKS